MATRWQNQDYSTNTTFIHPPSPSFVSTQRPITPLILPCDWLDSYPSDDFGAHLDFQSNLLDLSSARPVSDSLRLSGLGIRNLDLSMDLASFDNTVSEVADIFERGPMNPNELDFQIVSRNRSKNNTMRRDSSWNASRSGSPWFFPLALNVLDADDDSSTDLNSSSSEGIPPVARISSESVTGEIIHFFEEVSAAAGLSSADFAAQISATAEVALKSMEGDDTAPAGSNEGDEYDPFQLQININDIAQKWFVPDSVPPFDNSIFRNVLPSWNNSCAGVNPADILPIQRSPEIPTPPSAAHLVHDPLPNDTLCNDKFRLPSSILENDVSNDGHSFLHPAARQENRQPSEDEYSIFQSPSSSEYSPPLPGGAQKKTMPARNNKRKITRSGFQSRLPLLECAETPIFCDENTSIPINLGTPIFDAHRGIDIEVLKTKAERYRLRNQGRDYDKRWLISFAGKLSPRGELMEEFRCYIMGCKQTNKRRDHILIHVGAHLDQRPFKCMYWYVDKKSSLQIQGLDSLQFITLFAKERVQTP